MDWFNLIVSLGGGLALFLFGMNVLSNSLEKLSGGRMEKTLEKLTNSVWKGVLLGALVTAVIQSSTATTMIVVGLVNAGILKLRSCIGVIMGANIGTTITAQILRIGGFENDANANFFMSLLKPTTLAPIVAVIGIVFLMAGKRAKYKDIGTIMLGFAVLFTGMFTMEEAVGPLAEVPAFSQAFATLQNPFLGILAGIVVTVIIQSSSASVGILQALSATGAITYASAVPIILGQNIGTCLTTALLASIGASKNAKRTAIVHFYFNIIGSILFLAVVYTIQSTIGFPFWFDAADKGGIADFHTIFNVSVTLVFIPFVGLLEKLAKFTIRGDDEGSADGETSLLDERLLVSPGLALAQCMTLLKRMAGFARQNLLDAMALFSKFDKKSFDRVMEQEETIDRIQDRLDNYLQKMTDERELTDSESRQITYLLHLISEIERIGDYAVNIADRADMCQNRGTKFSQKGTAEMKTMFTAVEEIVTITASSVENTDVKSALLVEPLEQTIDVLEEALKSKHIQRIKKGKCSVDAGIIFLETIADLERVADHCSNIAVYVIGDNRLSAERSLMIEGEVNQHAFLHRMHEEGGTVYENAMKMFMDKYVVPLKKE
ncbi:MAG: Na/Pi cotransporter family protein [Oscillospiraceae bacterium]|nr:Na/Pi cotransporter family protein [Oscillospiraceae bacterium]